MPQERLAGDAHGRTAVARAEASPGGARRFLRDRDREPLPERVVPMPARLGELPADEEAYGFEVKWDGIRAIGFWDGAAWRLESRNLRDVTATWPEIRAIGRQLGPHTAVL